MLVLKDRLIDVPIMSLQTGSEIALTAEVIIDPRQLQIVAFYCKGERLDDTPAILHTTDIRETSELGFIVDSAQDLMPTEGLVRLQEVLDFQFVLDNKQVIDTTGRKVGKVSDYAVETTTFYIMKLHVRPSIWQSFSTSDVLIDRTQIKEITETHIIVKAPIVEAEERVRKTELANPFRRTEAPQPHSLKSQR